MPDKLFVYGTLKPGESNHHLLSSISGSWEKATVRGEHRDVGWSAEMHYPGVILDDNGDKIEGYVFTSENLSNHWDDIDRFEGNDYRRVKTNVELEDGQIVEAYIYEFKTG